MLRDGDLPPGQLCMVCGRQTDNAYDVYVQCESRWVKGPGIKRYLFVILTIVFLPFWLLWALVGIWLLDEKRQELGRDRGVTTPLRLCAECRPEVLKTRRQSKLRRVLSEVPVYASLLRESPTAKIFP